MNFLLVVLFLQAHQILTNHFVYDLKVIPHPDKIQKGGEDSHFVNNQLLSVADGVGGWNNQGIDPSLYSKELSNNIGILWNKSQNKYQTNPKQLIIDTAQISKNKGSSTLVILNLDQSSPILHTSYIGDSGYIIFRLNNDGILDVIYESEEQQHSFNYPYQIGNPGDDPNHSITKQHQIQDGDFIVLGSDGLFDNLNSQQIKTLIQNELNISQYQLDHQIIASKIAEHAFDLSVDKRYESPFAKKARQQGHRFLGGKSDDITVVFATIKIVQQQQQDL